MEFSAENVCGFLIRSRLMTPEEMKNMYQRWLTDGKSAGTGSFTKWLAANDYVSEYQATLLAKGHGEPEAYFINQYRILDRLGRGRMAGVYKAVHTLGQVVAIKVLPPSRAKNAHMLGRFQREARLALRLKHPNVVRSFQIGETAGLHYLVMEYLEGETLDEVLQRRKKLPPQEAVRLIHQALLGLEHIHEQGMVHRDLKPANLMLVAGAAKGNADSTLAATVKVLDIGLGRVLFDEEDSSREKLELTGEGVILGTPDYLAPEQARDPRSIDIRADIYSLGCVLYHALSGQPPFPDPNILNQMVRHATEPPRPLQQFNPTIPDGLQQIVNYMMAKQPAERYPTPERAAQALEMFLIADSMSKPPSDEQPQLKKYLTWLEAENGAKHGDVAQPLPQAAPLPMATPTARVSKKTPVPPTMSAHHDRAGARPHGKKRKKHKHRAHDSYPTAQPAAPANPARPEFNPNEIDVELVPLSALTPLMDGGAKWLGMAKRDWILLGMGAGAIVFAVVLGIILASALRD
ncbi:MAG: serine/threonine protein kinase [Gemmataceae bacterium]|nr:serine/threonine protein kinase [Gemmataceae bacterium]MCI0739561.1 serine/threonine protein kinase [Gemmataceae bacterium]